jgi:hypothetical protein
LFEKIFYFTKNEGENNYILWKIKTNDLKRVKIRVLILSGGI